MSSRARKSHYGRVQRVLRNKAPKLVENTKRVLGMRGLASSEEITAIVRDLVTPPPPHSRPHLTPAPPPPRCRRRVRPLSSPLRSRTL